MIIDSEWIKDLNARVKTKKQKIISEDFSWRKIFTITFDGGFLDEIPKV